MDPTQLLFANDAESELAAPMTSGTTTVFLVPGSGQLFPNPTGDEFFVITAIDAATGLLKEIMWCTQRVVDTLTVVRAQEGTIALAWKAGDLIQNLWTAGQAAAMEQMNQPVTITQTIKTFAAGTSDQLVAANANRKSLSWQNIGTDALTIAPGAVTVTVFEGQQLSPGATGPIIGDELISLQEFSAISENGTTILIWEGQ